MRLVDLFKFVGKPMVSMPTSREKWKELAEEIAEKVAEALDYWCWNVSPDTPAECYAAHSDLDLYSLAEEFAGWSRFGITDTDIELLKEMPEDIFDEVSRELQRKIERVVRELE